ncbi:MAG TPA: DUF308 domain-containing protein [Acidimicrobiales bacterium]
MTDPDGQAAGAIPPPPRPIEHAGVESGGWWLASIVGGIALALLGVWMLANPFESVVVLAWLVGISLIVAGVVEILALHHERGLGVAVWLSGGLLVVAGVAVLAWPDATLWTLAVLAGAGLVLTGAARILVALTSRGRTDMPVQLALGGLSVAVGAAVLAWPDATLVVLAVLLGLRAVATGLVGVGMGWQFRNVAA